MGHCIGTVPGVLQKDVAELNQLLGCAQAALRNAQLKYVESGREG